MQILTVSNYLKYKSGSDKTRNITDYMETMFALIDITANTPLPSPIWQPEGNWLQEAVYGVR